MKISLNCPFAKYDSDMRIVCEKEEAADFGGMCLHQKYKPCKGWNVLTDSAKECPLKEEKPKKRTVKKK